MITFPPSKAETAEVHPVPCAGKPSVNFFDKQRCRNHAQTTHFPNTQMYWKDFSAENRNVIEHFLEEQGQFVRPTLMRDRKRKIPDRKSAVSDLAKSFSFREQKLSYVRSKNRLGFTCGVSCIPLFASSNADR